MSRIVSNEGVRGCGFRKIGGIYLVADGPGTDCPLLPKALVVCPCCGTGIKQTRGWTWIRRDIVAGDGRICDICQKCGIAKMDPASKLGLVWIGAAFYPTPGHFIRESGRQGISRRVRVIPRGFKVGETWIAIAHPAAIPPVFPGDKPGPGIFQVFRPTRIEKIFAEGTPEEELLAAEAKGFTVVLVPDLPRHRGSVHEDQGRFDDLEG